MTVCWESGIRVTDSNMVERSRDRHCEGGQIGSSRGPPKGHLGAVSGVIAGSVFVISSKVHLGAVGSAPEAITMHLGLSWAPMGAILGLLGPSWACLGAILGPLGAVLGPAWALLEPSWGHLGPPWSPLGAIFGRLHPSWVLLKLEGLKNEES